MIRVGPAGWSYADWEGTVYPRRKPRGFHPLGHLARYVDCVEVNSSFYALPRADHAERWVAEVAERPTFRFTVKLLGAFTHEPLPEVGADFERLAHAWLAGVEPLRASGKLAGALVQFPLGFRHTPAGLDRLARIEGAFGHLRLVLEVRHRSWFAPAALRAVERLGYSLARIDLPPARDHPPADAPTFGPLGYLRVHGRNAATWFARDAGRDQRYDYLYTPEEVRELAAVTRQLAGGTDETYVITNNHFSGQAVANALELRALLDEGGSTAPLAPAELVERFPRLREVTRTDGQTSLF